MNYLKLLFSYCFSCVAVAQSNQQVSFRDLTVDHGLSQNSVVNIAQDSIGYMWFATQDGLNKYDGRTFKHYNIQFEDVTRPTYSKLGNIYADKSNGLWLVSNSGILEKYHQASDSFITVSNLSEVSTLIQDADKNYYIGTYGKGLYKISHQTKDTLQVLKSTDAQRTINDFMETTDQTILATTANGLIEINKLGYKFLAVQSETNFSALAQSKTNHLYLGSYGKGLFIKRPSESGFNQFTGFASHDLPDDLIIQDLLYDQRNRLWVATYGQGLYVIDFEAETIQNFTENKNDPYALHYNDVLSLYEDRTGTIWLGTDGAGLSYYDAYLVKFNVLTNDQVPLNVNVDVVRAITTDNHNTIWLGTSGKGLTRINNNTKDFATYNTGNSKLLGDRIMSLLYEDDKLWIGHQTHGLQIRDAMGGLTSFKETAQFTIWNIYKDAAQNIWLCTRDQGLIQFDEHKGIVRQFTMENSNLTSNNIRVIVQGDANSLWIGTEDAGIFKLDIKTSTIQNIELILNPVKSLYFDNGTLWIGTNGNGLMAYKEATKEVKTFTKEQGLPNNVIYGILPGFENELWLSSNKGISKIAFESDTIDAIENYSNYDGLQAFEFNTGAYYKDQKGTLYFGGLKGVNWFNPGQLEFNPIQPETVISGFEVFSKNKKLIENQALKHNENTVSFTFSSLHFSQPERNQYKYRLVNNDPNWIESGNNNLAHYTNLPPNDYEFQVISSNYDDVWNETPATYRFTILKPWYSTHVAYIIYGLLVVIGVFIFYRYLAWRLQMKTQLEFEHKEAERLKKLDEFKNRLFTNISHEFRTPLTLISEPIENQLSKAYITIEDKEELTLVKRNAGRLLNLVNQILDLSKLETGHLKLTVAQDDLELNLKQLVTPFKFKAQKKQIDFTYSIDKTENVWFDKDVIEKIVLNLLSNALKYTPQNGFVRFESLIKNEHVVISVINNGVHYSKEDLQKLFNRYYQADKNNDGAGIGLALVKELAILSHGNIIAHTLNVDEIQFTVTLPIERSYFKSTELGTTTAQTVENEEADTITEESFTIEKDQLESKPLLLLVEDDDDIRLYVKSILQNYYKVIEATNGKQGVKKAFESIPDVIISDVMMPIEDGISLCNTLKQDEKTSHIPIILLTAKAGDEHEITGLKVGADAYVTKPFNKSKLLVQIENLLNIRAQLQKRYSKDFKLKDLAVSNTEQQFLEKLYTVLNEFISASDFNAETLSNKLHMSRMQLHRKLKAITGLSTTEFITKERLKLTLPLLKKSDATISEIAYQVGFNSPSYFSTCFKKHYNTSPDEYRSSQ